MGIINFIQDKKSHGDIEYRLFDITLKLTVFVFLFWASYAFFANYNSVIKLIYSVSLIVYSGLYIAFQKGGSFKVLTILYYTLGFIMLAIGWLPSGGFDGAIMHMFVLIYVSGLLVLPLRKYVVFILCTLSLILVFSVYEYNYPEAAVVYSDQPAKIVDLSIAGVLMLSLLGFGLYVFKKDYLQDREQLQKLVGELEKEKEKAQAADKVKSEFLTTISHEMRTPLNGIIGITELLGKTRLDDEQSRMLEHLHYSSRLLYSLISDVLDLSLIQDGKLVLKETEIDIEDELREITEIFKLKIKQLKKTINISYLCDSDIPGRCKGDLIHFRQILINLVNNAVKFTDFGEITIQARLINKIDEKIRIKFWVTDTGRGIPKEKQELLFEQFYIVRKDLNNEGTGLGLSISKKLVELMGGTIGLNSETGKGSVFYFELPFIKQAVPKIIKKRESNKQNFLQDKKVLVAEDVKINQLVIQRMLNNMGIREIDMVENGVQACEKALSKQYDFIFMDIQMPELDGVSSARRILKNREKENKPIIVAVTANVSASDLEDYSKAGISDTISKPFTSQTLRSVLEKYSD